MNEKLPVSVKEACALLHCNPKTLSLWMKQGTVEATRIGGTIEVWLPTEMVRKPTNNQPETH